MLKNNMINEKNIELIYLTLQNELEKIFKFADRSKYPNKKSLGKYIYAK